MTKPEQAGVRRIHLDFKGVHTWFGISWFDTDEELRKDLWNSGVVDAPDDAIAYTDTWSLEESLENGIGDRHCCGHMYLIRDDTSSLAHEATHMALGILARAGETNLPVVTTNAPEIEENLCALVGFIADELYRDVLKAQQRQALSKLLGREEEG